MYHAYNARRQNVHNHIIYKKIKEQLKFEDLGFISEQQILRYHADELHPIKKIVIEIYGDYCHANPKKFKENDLIRLHGQSFYAHQKWKNDFIRKQKIENEGYKVIIIWESDDLNEKKDEILKLMQEVN